MEWDDAAETWDEGRAQRAYAAAAFESLRRAAGRLGRSLEGARVCDFGCGTGLLTERLAPLAAHVDAVDTSRAMLEVVRAKIERYGWDHVAPRAQTPRDGEAYDLIVCSSVCAFLDDYPATVHDLVQRLAPAGLFVQWDWALDPDSDEPFGLTPGAIRGCLEGAGLQEVSAETAFEATVDGQTMRPLMGVGRKPTG